MLLLQPPLPSEKESSSEGLPRTRILKASLCLARNQSIRSQVKCLPPGHPEIGRAPFFKLDDIEVVKVIGSAFGPELEYLMNTTRTRATSPLKTTQALGSQHLTPAQLLFASDFSEINRTVVSVLALKWLVAGQYEVFTSGQESSVRLSRNSFFALRSALVESLGTCEEVYALIVATIINDLGKNPALWEDIRSYLAPGKSPTNHDDIIFHAARLEKIPLISEFPRRSSCRTSLMLGLSLGSFLNLSAIRRLQSNSHAFILKFFEIILDVAGAQGHIDSRSCLTITEPLYRSFFSIRKTLADLMAHKLSLQQAYNATLQQKASLISDQGFRSHEVDRPQDRALLRLLCIGRVSSLEDANLFDTAFASLDPIVQSSLVNGLSVDGVDDGTAIIPYYAPALFAIALSRVRALSSAHLINTLSALMSFLARIYRGTCPEPGYSGQVIECDLRFAQDVLKSEAFLKDPQVLDLLEIPKEAYSERIAIEDIARGGD